MRTARAIFAAVIGLAAAVAIAPAFAQQNAPAQGAQPAQPEAPAQQILRIFIGNALPQDLMRELGTMFSAANPAIRIEIETGGATAEAQQRMLGAHFTTKEPALDLVVIDVLRAAQLASAQWLEPLDGALGAEREAVMGRVLPISRAAATIGNRIIALPLVADAQFLYFRKDLLAAHGLAAPRSWEELIASAQTVINAAGQTPPRGFETIGANVESAVCTYLTGLWGAGEDLLRDGKPNLEGEHAAKPFQTFEAKRAANLVSPRPGEANVETVRQNLQSGTLVFGIGWGYAWQRLQTDPANTVKDRIGIAPVPGQSPERQTSCYGGWQVAVSSFSQRKALAVQFARFLASPEAQRKLAMTGRYLPVLSALYAEPELLAAQPWLADALPVLQRARLRPVTPRYPEVSEIIRTNVNAVLSGTRSSEAAVTDMRTRLGAIFR